MPTAAKKRPAAKKAATKKAAAKQRPAAKQPTAKQPAARKATAKQPAAAARAMPARRADFGRPIDGFFAKHPPHLRAILEALRELIERAAPEATAVLKWGMPVYELDGQMMCAINGFKAHVNLILAAPLEALTDPDGRLEGGGQMGRHLKLRALDELPRADVARWLAAAVQHARARAAGA